MQRQSGCYSPNKVLCDKVMQLYLLFHVYLYFYSTRTIVNVIFKIRLSDTCADGDSKCGQDCKCGDDCKCAEGKGDNCECPVASKE